MQQYLARRLLLFIPTLLVASLGIFAIMRIVPGDVALIILGGGDDSNPATQAQLEELRDFLDLNDPLPTQYGKWIWSLVNGEFGEKSVMGDEPMTEILARRVPVTLQLTFYAVVLSFMATAVLIEASLSFLGLGVPPPHPSWGGMLELGAQGYIETAPWLAVFPGVALSLVVFSFAFFGDALRDAFDPRLRGV